jgi:hypothetical protein
MSFSKSDVGFFLSGGSSNTDINLSLGNAISSFQITSGLLNNLFPDTTPQEALSGITRYRCFYIKNLHGSTSYVNPKIWIVTNTISAYDEIDIAIGSANKNATEDPIATEQTAPSGISFSHPTSESIALSLPTLDAGDYKSVWARITTQSGANPQDNNATILRVRGTPL